MCFFFPPFDTKFGTENKDEVREYFYNTNLMQFCDFDSSYAYSELIVHLIQT